MTLVEVLVASVLLGVGVAGLISTATLALRNQTRTDQRATALWLAQEKLADVEVAGPRIFALSQPSEGTEVRGRIAYTWSIDIERQLAGELFNVLVELRWTDASRRPGSIRLETLLNDYEAAALTAPEQRDEATVTEANAPETMQR